MADELSIWDDDLEGVTERRAVLPGPVAVLNDFVGVESTRGRDRDRLQHGVVAIAPSISTCSNSETKLGTPTESIVSPQRYSSILWTKKKSLLTIPWQTRKIHDPVL